MLPDDISRERATYQYGGTSSSDDLLHKFIELGVNPSKKELLKFKEKYLNPYNNNVFAWNKYFIIRTNMESNENSVKTFLKTENYHFISFTDKLPLEFQLDNPKNQIIIIFYRNRRS